MKYSILFTFYLAFLFGSCQTKQDFEKIQFKEDFNFRNGLMKSAW